MFISVINWSRFVIFFMKNIFGGVHDHVLNRFYEHLKFSLNEFSHHTRKLFV